MEKTYVDFSSDVLSRISDIDVDVWQSQFEVVHEDSPFRLLHYIPIVKTKYGTPLLIVYAFINRPYVLDLSPEVSVVQHYLKAGFDVYMIDWGYPTAADQYLDIDDYITYMDRSVECIKERNNVNEVNLHGYCLGGTLSSIYTVLRQNNIKNLILQATPIDFHTDNTIALWARAMDPDKIVNAYQMAPGDFMNIGFLLVNPINLIIGKYAGLLEKIESDVGMLNFLRMDKWIFDSPGIPGATYRQYINDWYKENLVIKGEFKAFGEKVDLKKITVPILVLAATYDHIVPPEAQRVTLDIVSSEDKDIFEIAKGHIGITTSGEGHREFWPKVVNWLEKRSL